MYHFSFITFPEYAVLVHGLYKLLVKTSNPMHKSSKHPSLKPSDDLSKLFKHLKDKKLKHYRAWIGILLALVFIIIFALLSLATPIMDIAHAFIVNKCYPDCKEQRLILIFTVVYESVHFIVHALSPVIVAGMVVTVLVVKAIWFHIDMKDETKTDDIAASKLTENEEVAIEEYYKRVTEYRRSGNFRVKNNSREKFSR